MDGLKVIKLDYGEVIFAKVEVNDDAKKSGFLQLQCPMAVKVIDKEEEGELGIGLCKWIPFTQQAMIPLATKSIISIADLDPKMQIFYTNAVKEMVEVELIESKKKKSDISELLENLEDDNALLN
tara:strand:- start:50 stop:424 length:375 start_codon:yes stop_codon:yes gene_type:complete